MTYQTDIEAIISKLTHLKNVISTKNIAGESAVLEIFRGCCMEIGCEIEEADNAISDTKDGKFKALHIEAQGFLRGLTLAFEIAEEAFKRAETRFKNQE